MLGLKVSGSDARGNWRFVREEKNVTVYYPLFEDTVDTLVWRALQRKKEIIDTIIGDETIINEIIDNLDEAFAKIKELI